MKNNSLQNLEACRPAGNGNTTSNVRKYKFKKTFFFTIIAWALYIGILNAAPHRQKRIVRDFKWESYKIKVEVGSAGCLLLRNTVSCQAYAEGAVSRRLWIEIVEMLKFTEFLPLNSLVSFGHRCRVSSLVSEFVHLVQRKRYHPMSSQPQLVPLPR